MLQTVAPREFGAGIQPHCGARLNRIDCAGFCHPRHAAILVTDQKLAFPAIFVAQPVFGFEERISQRSVHISVDQGVVRARHVVRVLADIAARQGRDCAQKVVRVLLLDDCFHALFIAGVTERPGQTDAYTPHTTFQQAFHQCQHCLLVNRLL